MDKVLTKDGSVTFKNSDVDETYHSTSGAKEESLKKFVEPCLDLISKKTKIKVLDICFGLGYNSAALLDALLSNPKLKTVSVSITGIELDKNILLKILEIDSQFDSYYLIKELISKNIEKINSIMPDSNISHKFTIKKDNIKLTLIIGNALSEVKLLNEKFNICFFDPFSPKKHPHLWTLEFFKDIFSLLDNNSILTTYSCARIVRDNLKSAGFTIKDGPCVGRRAPSTIAIKG